VNRAQLLERLDRAWTAFLASYAGLPESVLLEAGVTGAWSVRDLIAHVTWWEAEALTHLPLLLEGGRPLRYSVRYGGIDAFNALMTERKKELPLRAVLREQAETHRRLVELVQAAPEDQIRSETRWRRRLKLDTYGHYPKHAAAIVRWRAVREAGRRTREVT
jgi:hypothetical protein